MAQKRDWLPDFMADWYDEFESFYFDGMVDDWKYGVPTEVEDFETRLCSGDPHRVAADIDAYIRGGKGLAIQPKERVYRGLQAANGAFATMGIATPVFPGGEGWAAIRTAWSERGNLLHKASGVLLPERTFRYRWARRHPRPPRKQHDIRSHFRQFLRWRPTSNKLTDVDVHVIADVSVPTEDLHDRLKIGFVPLVASKDDFEWKEVGLLGRKFRASIKDPAAVTAAAQNAISRAGEASCDVVVMPELCLTPEIQDAVAAMTRRTFAKHRHPWLVLAGTALTPVGKDDSDCHNRARVFDGYGDEVLRYNKLHAYQMSSREQTRYALHDALGIVPRTEDILVTPRKFALIESPIGRVGVVICEDLSNEAFVCGLIEDLDLDWLLVPVMDGCQTEDRWTAKYAKRCAERHASVVVVTTTSLYTAHLATLDPRPDPIGVGLVARPGQGHEPRLEVVRGGGSHCEVTVATYTAP